MDGLPRDDEMTIERINGTCFIVASTRCPAGQVAHRSEFAWFPKRVYCGGWTWLRRYAALLVFAEEQTSDGGYECVYAVSRPGFVNEVMTINRVRAVEFGLDPIDIAEREP